MLSIWDGRLAISLLSSKRFANKLLQVLFVFHRSEVRCVSREWGEPIEVGSAPIPSCCQSSLPDSIVSPCFLVGCVFRALSQGASLVYVNVVHGFGPYHWFSITLHRQSESCHPVSTRATSLACAYLPNQPTTVALSQCRGGEELRAEGGLNERAPLPFFSFQPVTPMRR